MSNSKALETLSETVRGLEIQLDMALAKSSMIPKWKWSPEAIGVVTELRSLASKNQELVRGELDSLLEWPTPEATDPTLFLGGKKGFEAFNRTDKWFDEMGYALFQTHYTFSNRWDKALINATFLVPKDLDDTKEIPFVWFFHGGGYCTGAGDFIPWYSEASLKYYRSKNAIVIAPDYPLGPEANLKDIADSIQDFLSWYKHDGCFEPGTFSWTEWLCRVAKLNPSTLKKNRILVEGESAGGQAAFNAMFLNAASSTGSNNNIKVVLSRYGMLKHYARKFPEREKVSFMGQEFLEADVKQRAEDIRAVINKLEKYGLVPTRTRDYPPHGMSGAFILSITRTWESMFRRKHLADQNQPMDKQEPDYMDCLERAVHSSDKVEAKYLPPIIMYHGTKDTNCPIEDTRQFKELLMKHHPHYVNNKNLFLTEVGRLNETPVVQAGHRVLVQTDEVAHAFDYYLKREKEPFLEETFAMIDQFW